VKRTPLRRVSPKRAALNVKRRALVADLLLARPWCERCQTNRSTDVHEPHSRAQGGDILDRDNLRAVCRKCHSEIHAHPAESYATGWLIPRSVQHERLPL